MSKKLFHIFLIASVFLSITGYTIPCTLHCMNTHGDKVHSHAGGETSHDHHHEQESDCKGMCSLEKMMNQSSNQQESNLPNAMHLSQYLSKLLVAHLLNNRPFLTPDSELFLKTEDTSAYQSWIPEPVIPPPQSVLPLS